MIAVFATHIGDPGIGNHLECRAEGPAADHGTKAVVPVHDGEGQCPLVHMDRRVWIDAAAAQAISVRRNSHDTMGMQTHHVGLDENPGGDAGVVFRQAGMLEGIDAELGQ